MSFTYVISPNSIRIFGDFRSGYDFEYTKELFENVLNVKNITIDLTNVAFMDSTTINFIKKFEDKDVDIYFTKDSWVYKRYLDKTNRSGNETN